MTKANKDNVVIYASKDKHLHAYDWLEANAAYCSSAKVSNKITRDFFGTSFELNKFTDMNEQQSHYELKIQGMHGYSCILSMNRKDLQKLLRELQMFLLIKD